VFKLKLFPLKQCLDSSDLCKRPLEDDSESKEAELLQLNNSDVGQLSKKKAKKLLRNPKKKFIGGRIDNFELCTCRSPRVRNYVIFFSLIKKQNII